MRQDAILRDLEIVCEVVRKLPPELQADVPRADRAAAIGPQEWLRNGYPVVELDIVWRTVNEDVLATRRAMEEMLRT